MFVKQQQLCFTQYSLYFNRTNIMNVKPKQFDIKINQIQSIPLYSIVDLCAVVLEVTDKVTKHTRNGDQFMKKIVLKQLI